MTRRLVTISLLLLLLAGAARAEKIRTLANILGAEPMTIQGQGIVTGLNGTGDKSPAALKLLKTYLVNNDLNLDLKDLASRNIALVNIDAEIPPFVRVGQAVNLRVTSVGDASSLAGGVLHAAMMRFRPDGPSILRAAGRISVGTHPTTGRIAGGGQMLAVMPVEWIGPDDTFTLIPKRQSFTDAAAIAAAINNDDRTNVYLTDVEGFATGLERIPRVARALDAGAVLVTVPPKMRDRKVEYVSEVMNLDVSISRPAKVLINRQTNTIVITGEVQVDPVAISHRNLSVTLAPRPGGIQANRPPVYNLPDNAERRLVGLEGPGQIPNLQNLIDTLNAMGVSTDDVIVIVEKLKAAGALHADLIVE